MWPDAGAAVERDIACPCPAAGSAGAASLEDFQEAAAETAGESSTEELGLHACLLLRTLFYELLSLYGPAILAVPPSAPPDDCVLAAAAALEQRLPQHVLLLLEHYVVAQRQLVAQSSELQEIL